jgi:hypothetical protein
LRELLAWLEASMLGHAMRNSGVWSYGVVNLVHILGVSSLFGAIVILDLRLMRMWREVALASITTPAVRVASVGFFTAMSSGVCLLATKGSEYAGNPFLYIKFCAIGLGMLNVAVLRRSKAWKEHGARELSAEEQSRLAWFGGVSLFCWLSAIAAGRMVAYW